MSRAFVKEEEGQRWSPPPTPRAFQLIWRGEDRALEVLSETDDLTLALRWLAQRSGDRFELREGGVILARSPE